MSSAFKCTKTNVFLLLCLMLASGGCRSAVPEGLTVQSTHSPTPQPTKTDIPHHVLRTPSPTVVDRGLLYGKPCAPPCWEGITPGISSEDDVIRILDQLTLTRKTPSQITFGDYGALGPSSIVDIKLDGEYVAEIRIDCFYSLGFDYRVKQVIERFGETEAYVPRSRVSKAECHCERWDDSKVYAYPFGTNLLLYPLQGVTIAIAIDPSYTGCICPEMRVSTLYYYQPRSLVDALQEGRSSPFWGADLSSEGLVQWHGYGGGY